ncbi:MAG: tetratricopeptide repeat protein [Nitrospirae bacterium]|nr:tetratricopeptide repeat protein [Nitrospirota bacterium]
MDNKLNADELFKKGLVHLSEKNRLGALACFEKASVLSRSPEIQSYLGYCIAAERGKVTEALKLCEEALGSEPSNPVHYLNLGRVYLKASRKDEAIAALRKGLSLGDNGEIRLLLSTLGIRRKPVFSFLPRTNALNRLAGLLLSRLRLRQ